MVIYRFGLHIRNVSHGQILIPLKTSTMATVKHMSRQIFLWKCLYYMDVIETSIHESKYHKFLELLKSRLMETILKQCTMLYPIYQRWYMYKIVYQMSTLSERK